jgi:superfamily II DNA or RNA helicase
MPLEEAERRASAPRADRVAATGVAGVQLPDWKAWLKTNRSKAARDGQDYDLHLGAHEWSLTGALDINRPEDFRSLPSHRVEPFDHQVQNAIMFFRRLSPRGLIADDVGLGKTITAGLIARELLSRGRVESILVVSPKSLLEQWQEELDSKFGIRGTTASGAEFTSLDSQSVWITSYSTARSKIDLIRARKFDLLILDEAHTLRNLYGTNGAPQVALAFQKLMRDDAVRFCLMLTATPIQNRLWDIFSLLEILKAPQPNPLGTDTQFAQTFVAGTDARRITRGSEATFRKLVSEATVRTRRKDTNLLFPKREVRDQLLKPLKEEAEFIDEALQVILTFPPLVQMTYARSLMSSPWALAESMEKKAAELQNGSPLRSRFAYLAQKGRAIQDSAKVRAVLKLAETAPKEGLGGRIIVFTQRLATVRHLYSALDGVGLGEQVGTIQGGDSAANLKAIRDFQAEPPRRRILLATDTGAVGLNLQAGNIVVNYDLPWNPMVVEQRIGRVQRLGQKAKNVIVYNLVLRGTIEDLIVRRLMEKLELFSQAIGEMEEMLELCGFDEEHRSLDTVIMDLIRKAGEQRDIAEDLEKAEASRRKAKERLEEMRRATEDALASIRPTDDGPVLTGLVRPTPRMELRELVLACLRREGVDVKTDAEGRIFGRQPNGSGVEFVIDRQSDLIDEPGVQLVAPGTKVFERIVKNVRDSAVHHLRDIRGYGLDRVHETLAEAAGRHGIVVDRLEAGRRKPAVALRLAARITASVAMDRFETLRSLDIVNATHGVGDLLAAVASESEAPGERAPAVEGDDLEAELTRVEPQLRSAVSEEPSVARFCSFYRERHEKELEKLHAFARSQAEAGGAVSAGVERAKQSLQFRFTPTRRADVIGLSGLRYDVATVTAFVRNRAQRGAIPIEIEAVPASGVVLAGLPAALQDGTDEALWACPGGHLAPEREFSRCSVEGCTSGGCTSCVEASAAKVGLSTCTSCQSVVCGSHSVTCVDCGSQLCGKHPDAVTTAGETACEKCRTTLPDGRTFRRSQLVTSAVSGQLIPASEATASQVSGGVAAPGELVECELSGTLLLPEEAALCAVTGKRVRKDLTEASAVSGRRALREKIVRSSFSNRAGLPDEGVLCDETGAFLLLDEVETCGRSRRVARADLLEDEPILEKRVLRRLLKPSDVSGRMALPEHLMASGRSGRLGLPGEIVHCDVCGKNVLSDETSHSLERNSDNCIDHFVESEKTGKKVLPQSLGTCELTGRRVEHEFLETCAESGKRVLADILTTCEVSGARVLPAETEVSAVSGKRVRKSLLVSCDVSGERALPMELERCSVSGKLALPRLMVTCAETGQRLLESMARRSSLTGEFVAPAFIGKCAVTGETAKRSLLGKDEVSGQQVLSRLLGTCELSGTRTVASNLETCAVSGKKVLPALMDECDETGRKVLLGKLGSCALTGLRVHPDRLVRCAETGRNVLRSKAEVCAETKEWIAPDRMGTCTQTGKRVRQSILGTDDLTGESVLSRLLVECEATHVLTIPARLGQSQVSGRLVQASLLAHCEESGQAALPDELVRCEASGKAVLPGLVEKCEFSGRTVLRSLLQTSTVSGKRFAPDRKHTCALCAAVVDVSESGRCTVCGSDCCRAELRSGQCRACRAVLSVPDGATSDLTKEDLRVLKRTIPWASRGHRLESMGLVHAKALSSRLSLSHKAVLVLCSRSQSGAASPLEKVLRTVPLARDGKPAAMIAAGVPPQPGGAGN